MTATRSRAPDFVLPDTISRNRLAELIVWYLVCKHKKVGKFFIFEFGVLYLTFGFLYSICLCQLTGSCWKGAGSQNSCCDFPATFAEIRRHAVTQAASTNRFGDLKALVLQIPLCLISKATFKCVGEPLALLQSANDVPRSEKRRRARKLWHLARQLAGPAAAIRISVLCRDNNLNRGTATLA